MQFYFLFKLSNTSLSVYPFSLALPIKSALFASALVLTLSGHGLLLAQSRTLQHTHTPIVLLLYNSWSPVTLAMLFLLPTVSEGGEEMTD